MQWEEPVRCHGWRWWSWGHRSCSVWWGPQWCMSPAGFLLGRPRAAAESGSKQTEPAEWREGWDEKTGGNVFISAAANWGSPCHALHRNLEEIERTVLLFKTLTVTWRYNGAVMESGGQEVWAPFQAFYKEFFFQQFGWLQVKWNWNLTEADIFYFKSGAEKSELWTDRKRNPWNKLPSLSLGSKSFKFTTPIKIKSKPSLDRIYSAEPPANDYTAVPDTRG